MFLTELTLSGLDRHAVGEIRWELFVFHDVRDVLRGRRPDTVIVVHRGTARPDAWCAALVAAGVGSPLPAVEIDRARPGKA